jgi:hypothetical protein
MVHPTDCAHWGIVWGCVGGGVLPRCSKMKIKNPPMFYLLVLFTLLNVMDMITTMFIIKGEANPLYHLTGSILPVFAIKIFVVVLIWFLFSRGVFSSNTTYFMLIVIMIYAIVALTFAQYMNIRAMLNPVLLEQAAGVTTGEKVTMYVWLMNIIYLFPIIMSWISFLLYDKSVKNVVINKDFYRKRKWWQI